MARRFAFNFLLLYMLANVRAFHYDLCNLEFCDCEKAPHPTWLSINCTLPDDQKLSILGGDVPPITSDLILTGGEAVLFGLHSLSNLTDLRLLRLTGTKQLRMTKSTAVDMNVLNTFVEIEDIPNVRIESYAFSSIKGPLSVTISNCSVVMLGSQAFSWLLNVSIHSIENLQLSQDTFTLDTSSGNVGEHGPGMSVEIDDVKTEEIPERTFGSSAAAITLRNIDVRTVRAGAFSANTYNIVMAINSTIFNINAEAFGAQSLIHSLIISGCSINLIAAKAVQSAIGILTLADTEFNAIESEAINSTVATIDLHGNKFHIFRTRAFEFIYWNRLRINGNYFDEIPTDAIVADVNDAHELSFCHNEMQSLSNRSFTFLGQVKGFNKFRMKYVGNYLGHPCSCNITDWIGAAYNDQTPSFYQSETYCTIDEILARCFVIPEQNIKVDTFIHKVCHDKTEIICEDTDKNQIATTEIKNPRFPHKPKTNTGMSTRNKKVVSIILVTLFLCITVVVIISCVKWVRSNGYEMAFNNYLASLRICTCFRRRRRNNNFQTARSVSQIFVNDYSERHRLHEPRVEYTIQEVALPGMEASAVSEDNAENDSEDKTTQTLPEELTKELLESLKDKLQDPENYTEAKEMIEHLYEIVKVEDNCNNPPRRNAPENVYELVLINTKPRIGKNNKQMISIGTMTPSPDELQPLSPYNRPTGLAHEYFEPKDMALHLYAEITNPDKRPFLGAIPDVVSEQVVAPRGPYLRALREKSGSSSAFSAPVTSSSESPTTSLSSPEHDKSNASHTSGKMFNRPLPAKPVVPDNSASSPIRG